MKDIRLEYTDQGTGTPIVLLHAFPLNRTMWAPQLDPFSTSFRTIAVDLRGHGGSSLSHTPYTLEDLATDIKDLLDRLTIHQAIFIGLSMGGYILMAFYRLYPDRVKSLILADTRAQADTADGRAGRFEMIRTAETQGASAIADIMIPRLLSAHTIKTNPELVGKVRAMILGNPVETIVSDLRAMAERPDSIPLLAKIARPTLVLVGELDQGTPPSDARLMAEHIPNAHLAILRDAGHVSNLENPEAFNEAVLSFLGRNPGNSS
ncbi:MAG TPA: alpha/beta fold hydrolase [Nitrospiraceae bacterium]|nr:alpha/beta fold hydrolase [Nitrospiraceae bacterium]